MHRLSRALWALCITAAALLSAAPTAIAEDEPSVLGALSDSPPRELLINSSRVYLYEHARNELLRQSGQHRDVTYYYAAAPTLKHDSSGAVAVDSYPAIGESGKEVVQITILPSSVSSAQVFAAMRDASVDAFADQSRLLNLTVYGIDVKVGNLPMVQVPQENAAPFSEPVSVSWVLPAGSAAQLRQAFASGAAAQVGYRTLQKLSQVQSTRISWGDVKKTSAFRNYEGPSGPKLLTAAQTVKLATSILSELHVFHWQELAAESGGADAKQYGLQLQTIIDRVIDRKNRREASFEEWLDPMRLSVPVDKWQEMVDVTKSISIDSKQLDHNEWCNKYKSQLDTLSKRDNSGSSGFDFGLKAIIPQIKTPFSLSFSNSNDDSSYSEDTYHSELTTEDCGKKIVENNFNYKWDGVKYEPKSIYVYERMNTAGSISDSEDFTIYTIRQRMGRNTWGNVK